jgi:hypothetical protein
MNIENLGSYEVLLKRITMEDSPDAVYNIIAIGSSVKSIESIDGKFKPLVGFNKKLSNIDNYGYTKVDVTEITGEKHN